MNAPEKVVIPSRVIECRCCTDPMKTHDTPVITPDKPRSVEVHVCSTCDDLCTNRRCRGR